MMRAVAITLTVVLGATLARSQTVPTFRSGTPSLSIPLGGGAPSTALTGISDVRAMPSGQLVATMCGSGQISAYDASGKPLWTIGKPGPGPGVSFIDAPPDGIYMSLQRVFPAGGDSIAVVDGAGSRRVTLLTGAGDVARSFFFKSTTPNSTIDIIGRLRDGAFVGRRRTAMPTDVGVYRPPIMLYRITPQGQLLDSTSVPGNEIGIVPSGPSRSQQLRLGRQTSLGVLADAIVVGTQDEAAFTLYDPFFRSQKSIPTLTKPEPVTDKTREEWIAGVPELIPSGGVGVIYHASFPDRQPAYRELAPSSDGKVWLQDPARAGAYPLVWTGYAGDRAVARVELPPRFHPTQFGPDWVLGVAYDSTNVAAIQRLPFVPGPLRDTKLSPRAAQPPNQPRCGPWMAR